MLWINIGLAAAGLGATLAAFGGETWRSGNESFVSRVTRRGWISLVCLIVAFSLGVAKEIVQQEQTKTQAQEAASLREENRQQAGRIDLQVRQIASLQSKTKDQVEEIESLQSKLTDTAEKLRTTTSRLAEQQLASIEAAFKMAIKIPRETDDAVVRLRGQRMVRIPSRHHDSMQLFWGDEFRFTIMSDDIFPTSRLRSLRLKVGERRYPLFEGCSSGYFENTLRIYGSSPEPMPALIENPNQLRGVLIKIFVRTTDSSQGQSEFRKLILTSPFREFARRRYKVTTADVLNIRSSPRPNAPILSRLTRGSFVHVLQTANGWAEVMTPEGRQGWVDRAFVTEIE